MKNFFSKKFKLIGLSILMLVFPVMFVSALTSISQGTTSSFAILGGSTITNTGPSVVTGDIGLYPGTSFVNSEGITLDGTIHVNDAEALAAKNDLVTVYNQVSGLLPVTTIASQLGGQTLLPGIYDSADGTFALTGTLILDANGDSNSVFVFKAASTLITATSSNISLINAAEHCNVFWKVGSSATFGTNSYFVGHVYAMTSITANTGAEIDGQLLARNGAVTLDTNTITNAVCPVNITVDEEELPVIPENNNVDEEELPVIPENTTVDGGELPSTSTNLYQIMFIGILLLAFGFVLLVISASYVKKNK